MTIIDSAESAFDRAPTISTTRASVRERRLAILAALVLAAITSAGMFYHDGREIVTGTFLAAFAGSTGMADAIAVALLLTLYRADPQRIVLFAACAYLFNAILVVPYALTFPGVVDDRGYFGNEQTAAFLWLCWHYLFAAAIGIGRVLERRDVDDSKLVTRVIVATVGIAAFLTAYATIGKGGLPSLVHSHHFSSLYRALVIGACIFNAAVAFAIGRERVLSSLRLWLAIALIASALDMCLNAVTPGRFTATWLLGKFDQFITASIVLFSLFGAWSSLYIKTKATTARLASTLERERRLQNDFDRERRTSSAFQQAALPRAMPTVPNLSFSAVYQAAGAEAVVGGDWYDAFRIDDGRIVLSVGDVMGSGLAAAVTMNAMRQAVRGAAQLHADPVAIIDAADRVLISENPDSVVTTFVAIVDPITRMLSFASAGHPPALLRTPDGTILTLDGSGLPLGLRGMPQADKQAVQTMLLPEGALLVLYTDGLTETTRDVVEGETRLRDLLASDTLVHAKHPAETIANRLSSGARDDVAIMTVFVDADGSDGSERPTHWSFPAAERERAVLARAQIDAELVAAGASEDDIAIADLIFSELVGNVYRHCPGKVDIFLDSSHRFPVLHVLDRGPGFTFVSRLPSSIFSETGRGLFVVSTIARDLNIANRPGGGSHARVVLPFTVEPMLELAS